MKFAETVTPRFFANLTVHYVTWITPKKVCLGEDVIPVICYVVSILADRWDGESEFYRLRINELIERNDELEV